MKFLALDLLHAKFWYILIAGVFWILYISYRVYKDRSVLQDWGMGLRGFKQTFKILTIPALVVVMASVLYGTSKGILIFNWHIIPVMFLYPLWGTIQQLLIISVFGGNIYSQQNFRISQPSVIGLTSILFSVVHYPSLPLMVATFFLAVFYCLIFFRFRNILVLGIFHGWLACIFYFFVLGRDPWVEFVSSM